MCAWLHGHNFLQIRILDREETETAVVQKAAEYLMINTTECRHRLSQWYFLSFCQHCSKLNKKVHNTSSVTSSRILLIQKILLILLDYCICCLGHAMLLHSSPWSEDAGQQWAVEERMLFRIRLRTEARKDTRTADKAYLNNTMSFLISMHTDFNCPFYYSIT